MEEFIKIVYNEPFTEKDEEHFQKFLDEVRHLDHVKEDIERYGLDEYKKRFQNSICLFTPAQVNI